MATTVPLNKPRGRRLTDLPPLENGDRLDQPTFHARCEAMPEDVRAQLVGGTVYMPSPVRRPHGRIHKRAMEWLLQFESNCPGTELILAESVILGPESEPIPDICLRLLPGSGGKTEDLDEYVTGAPELVVEVASSSAAYDLHQKKDDYERAGVAEYLVLVVAQKRARWFQFREGRYHELAPDTDGIYRSEIYPGLWLDPRALLRGDTARVRQILESGLATPEHQAWAAALAGAAIPPA